MAILSRTTLASAALAAVLALPAAPAAADAATELVLFNFGTAADRPTIEYAEEAPVGPMPLLPVEYDRERGQDRERDQSPETGAGGS
jgi:hypothetical protein